MGSPVSADGSSVKSVRNSAGDGSSTERGISCGADMKELYDGIGRGYSTKRCTDPKIYAQIAAQLQGADSILNIGAGSGSYEPENIPLIALEPSQVMINQRPEASHPAVCGRADSLPFPDNAFTHAMTVLSMHHWQNRDRAFEEIQRVTQRRFIAVTWMPDLAPFWLTDDYFPEILDYDRQHFPLIDEIKQYFTPLTVNPLLIPHDCRDGFLGCFWQRPEAYLQPAVRACISTFTKIKYLDSGLKRLRAELLSGAWSAKYSALLSKTEVDLGYRILVADF